MPPIPNAAGSLPRLIVYHQTHHDRSGKPISALPLINSGVTHVYIAAVHLNDRPEHITLNDHPPGHERNTQLWEEVKQLQDAGIKCMGMLGGAAKGSYEKLARDFEAFYGPLRDLIRSRNLDGLDLDIEEPTPLALTIKLLQRLNTDFGSSFILTLAPVLPALLPLKPYLTTFCYRLLHPELPPAGPLIRSFIKAHLLGSRNHLSGFNHFELESSEAGRLVHWYNVQFYCGWGDAGDERLYEAMIASGWNPRKLVLGVITNPENGSGYVDLPRLGNCIGKLRQKHGENFGGVMGWEYFNAGGNPEGWVRSIAGLLGKNVPESSSRTADNARLASGASAEPPVPAALEAADIQAAMRDASLVEGQAGNLAPAHATADSAPASSDDSKVQRLVDMGFERGEAIAALEAMGGDVDAAAGILFGD